jgi:DNA replication and repair protein RecF
MLLRFLWLQQFRGCAAERVEFSPGLNVLVGANAQGKTSFLEAIYLLATSKSMRGSRDEELIRWEAPLAVAGGEVLRERAADVELEVLLSRTERKALVVNRRRVARAGEFIGQLRAVAFSAAELEVVRGEPACRRRFLDLEIAQLSPAYVHALVGYRRALEQRNRLLKQGGGQGVEPETLSAWSEQLVEHGVRLVERRQRFVEGLAEYAVAVHAELSEGTERLTVAYAPSFRLPRRPPATGGGSEAEQAEAWRAALRESFLGALGEVRREELRRQVTLVGPHRDDVTLLLNGREARLYGSQGQQRSAALSIKLAELRLMKELGGEAPVCLLDDVFSELDARRRAHLFASLGERGQTVLTTTELELLPAELRAAATVFRVEGGSVQPW